MSAMAATVGCARLPVSRTFVRANESCLRHNQRNAVNYGKQSFHDSKDSWFRIGVNATPVLFTNVWFIDYASQSANSLWTGTMTSGRVHSIRLRRMDVRAVSVIWLEKTGLGTKPFPPDTAAFWRESASS